MNAETDAGLWNDRQRDALKPILEFIKANGARAGVQLWASRPTLAIEFID